MSARTCSARSRLVLALLHVRAVEALDVVLVEDGGQRLDGFEIGLELFEDFLLENLGVGGALVDVVFEDVPAGEDDVVQVGQRNEILDAAAICCRCACRGEWCPSA